MILFNKDIDYQGQDLHILRNEEDFPLHKFFDNSATLSFDVRLPLDPNTSSYENIVITELPNQLNICASEYVPNPNEKEINSFFIEVTASENRGGVIYNESAVVLIYLHNEIDKAWTSPNTMSIRRGMELKFGVLASFTDGKYADLSFYPEMGCTLAENAEENLCLSTNGSQRIEWLSDPENDTFLIENAVTITLPPWMNNADVSSSDLIKVTGNIDMLKGFGNIHFHKGEIGDVDDRINILFLSDGFDDSPEADIQAFRDTIEQFTKEMLEKNSYSPWDLLSDKLNIWSCYTKDKSKYSSCEGEHIIIKYDDASPTIAELSSFISFFDGTFLAEVTMPKAHSKDSYISTFKRTYSTDLNNFINLEFSQNLRDSFPLIQDQLPSGLYLALSSYVNLSFLCRKVGLPSVTDSSISLGDKFAEWESLGWANEMSIDINNLNNRKFLHPYIYEVWLKLTSLIFIEKSDTTYGTSNALYRRQGDNVFSPTRVLMPGITKFPPVLYNSTAMEIFGKYINQIPNPNDDDTTLGSIFYTDQGDPKLGESLNNKLNFQLKPCDNILLLSRVRTNGLYGVNEMIKFEHSDNSNPPLKTDYYVHRTVVSLEGNITTVFKCNRKEEEGCVKYEQNVFNIKKRTKRKVRNTIAHEFSHNYLRDEYSAKEDNIAGKNDASDISKELQISNLTTIIDLEQTVGLGDIDGSKIKWRWPRIEKIGVGLTTNPSQSIRRDNNNVYKCEVKTNADTESDTKNGFVETDKILLRKRFLFDTNPTNYIRATVTEVVTTGAQGGDFQYITFQAIDPISDEILSELQAQSFIIIKPVWRTDEPDKCEELVHHLIKDAITVSSRPLLIKDTLKMDVPQKIDETFITNHNAALRKAGNKNKATVVGLYAGGYTSYNEGIYHSTGMCMMRDGRKNNKPNKFCPVCSYIMIDYIDPLQHPFMNEKRYPKYRY